MKINNHEFSNHPAQFMKKILFLGYDKNTTRLNDEIKFYNKKYIIKQTDKQTQEPLYFQGQINKNKQGVK